MKRAYSYKKNITNYKNLQQNMNINLILKIDLNFL